MKAAASIRNIVLVLLLSSGILYLLLGRLALDYPLAFGGNALLAVITIVSLLLGTSGNHSNPHAFMRGIYSGTLAKLFLIAAAAAIYIILKKGQVDKGTLGILGLMYIVYTALETAAMQRISRQAAAKS